jgi:hypothetical protein
LAFSSLLLFGQFLRPSKQQLHFSASPKFRRHLSTYIPTNALVVRDMQHCGLPLHFKNAKCPFFGKPRRALSERYTQVISSHCKCRDNHAKDAGIAPTTCLSSNRYYLAEYRNFASSRILNSEYLDGTDGHRRSTRTTERSISL